jgi:RES domain-containing protein
MVYTSTSLALAAMEFFVHLDPAAASKNLVSMSASLPDGIRVDHIEVNRLPTDWKLVDRDDLQQMGADWLLSNTSVALEVPSAVIAGEWNVLLNPRHPDFNNVVIADPEPFVFDPRMFK